MNKTTLSFGGLAAVIAAILFALQMNSGPKEKPTTAAAVDAGSVAPARLPALERVDAAAPPPVINLAYIKQNGLISQEARWLEEALPKRDWVRLPDEGAWPTFKAFNEITVSWKLEKGQIVGAVADFPEHALGATIAGMSPPFFGHEGYFPHLEDVASPAEGEVETPGGTLKYRCEMNDRSPSGPKHCDFDLVD